jgi:CBS domain-containing protein
LELVSVAHDAAGSILRHAEHAALVVIGSPDSLLETSLPVDVAWSCPCPVAIVGVLGDVTYVDGHLRPVRQQRALGALSVRDIMSSPAVTVASEASVAEALRLLDALNVTTLPVVDRELRLLGTISEAEVIAAADDSPAARVRDLMTLDAPCVSADDTVAEVVGLMTASRRSLPVVLCTRVVGMISRRDIVRAIAHGYHHPSPDRLAKEHPKA